MRRRASFAQHGIAGRVAEVQVDLTKIVEVDVARHHLAPVAAAAGQGLGQTIDQQQLVGQPRVRIGHGELPELVVLAPGRPTGPGRLGPRPR